MGWTLRTLKETEGVGVKMGRNESYEREEKNNAHGKKHRMTDCRVRGRELD